jgi:hypothetical protein
VSGVLRSKLVEFNSPLRPRYASWASRLCRCAAFWRSLTRASESVTKRRARSCQHRDAQQSQVVAAGLSMRAAAAAS